MPSMCLYSYIFLAKLYTSSVQHVIWQEKYTNLNTLKACAYDRLIEHLQVIIDGDFEGNCGDY